MRSTLATRRAKLATKAGPKRAPRSSARAKAARAHVPTQSARAIAARDRAAQLLDALRDRYPDAHCELNWREPHELLIATILSAQATDIGVNRATPALFQAFGSPAAFVSAGISGIEPFVRTINFWRNKSRAIHESMTVICQKHGGCVPRTMTELTALRGVARKTANVVLGNAFAINEGIVVDTHVMRLATRMKLFPQACWCQLSHLLISHGRRICKARGRLCGEDPICQTYCRSGASSSPRVRRCAPTRKPPSRPAN